MRLIRYERAGATGVGILSGEQVFPTEAASMLEVIESGRLPEPAGEPFVADRILAPLARPGKILGSGVNFKNHLDENPNGVLPKEPYFFSKLPSSVIGPGEAIVIDSPVRKVDYEVELAVVIGRRAKKVSADQALEHVFGYTVLHDVSARDIQFVDIQVTIGKGLDTFCPLGPAIVTRDEVPDPANLALRTVLNDEVVQDGTTSEWLFSIPFLVEYLSARITLEPGDIFTTGTPAGVGCFRTPELYLKPGDVVTVEVEGVGRLTNPVVAGW